MVISSSSSQLVGGDEAGAALGMTRKGGNTNIDDKVPERARHVLG